MHASAGQTCRLRRITFHQTPVVGMGEKLAQQGVCQRVTGTVALVMRQKWRTGEIEIAHCVQAGSNICPHRQGLAAAISMNLQG